MLFHEQGGRRSRFAHKNIMSKIISCCRTFGDNWKAASMAEFDLLPRSESEFQTVEYWERFYALRAAPFEWYVDAERTASLSARAGTTLKT